VSGVITLSDLFGNDRESGIRSLDASARSAWAEGARGKRWTLWLRLSWSWQVSEYAASNHVERWATRLIARMRGASVLVGLHTDQGRIHAHALVFIPRRGASSNSSSPNWLRGCALTWHQKRWRHGLIWLDRFSPGRTSRGKHGAAEYVAKDPGSVLIFGAAPEYQPRRRR
jgi:hypothetical protein